METRAGGGGPGLTLAVVGVESTGKTTLAAELADRLRLPLVPEAARGYLAAQGDRYVEDDLERIARLQWRTEMLARAASPRGVVTDTDLTVLRIWAEVRYGRCAPWILEHLARRPPAVYLLTRLDLPWEYDPQRESPDPAEREALHQRYRALLESMPHPFAEVGGAGPARLAAALTALEDLELLPTSG